MPSQSELSNKSSSHRSSRRSRGHSRRSGGSGRRRSVSGASSINSRDSLGSNMSYGTTPSLTGLLQSGASSRSASRASSRASNASTRASGTSIATNDNNYAFQEALLNESHCRVIHKSAAGKFKVVCCNLLDSCELNKHRSTNPDKRGPVGYYQAATHAKSGHFHGCVLSTHETEDARNDRLALERTRDRQLGQTLGLLSGGELRNQLDVSPHGETIGDWKLPARSGVSSDAAVRSDHGSRQEAPVSLEMNVNAPGVSENAVSLGLAPGSLPASSLAAAVSATKPISFAKVPVKIGSVDSSTHVNKAPQFPTGGVHTQQFRGPNTTGPSDGGSNPSFSQGSPNVMTVNPNDPTSAPGTLSLADLTAAVQQIAQGQIAIQQALLSNGNLGGQMGAPNVAPAASPSAAPSIDNGTPASILKSSQLYGSQNPVVPPKDAAAQAQDASLLQKLAQGENVTPSVSPGVPTVEPTGVPTGMPTGVPTSAFSRPGTHLYGQSTSPPVSGTYIPAVDPDIGNKKKAFGLPINNADALCKGMAPGYFGTLDAAQRFTEGIVDIVAYPNVEGTSGHHGDESSIAAALRTLTDQKNASSGGIVDTSYKNASRNRLIKVKTQQELVKLSKDVARSRASHAERIEGSFGSTIQFYHPEIDYDVCLKLGQDTKGYKVGTDLLFLYHQLLCDLVNTAHTQSWDLCKLAITHHGENLAKIRSQYGTRIQVMVGNYIYLRDQFSQGFAARDWLTVRLDYMEEHRANALGSSLSQDTHCSHCGTTIHATSVTCPWKGKSASQARKAAAAYIRKQISGSNGSGGGGGGSRSNTGGGGNSGGTGDSPTGGGGGTEGNTD